MQQISLSGSSVGLSFQKNYELQQKLPRALIVQEDDPLAQTDGFSIKNFSKKFKISEKIGFLVAFGI